MGRLLASAGDDIPGCELISVADPDEEVGKSFAEERSANYYPDYQHMLERESLDAMLVATPEFIHRDPVVEAAKNGLHVFVEKPLATNLEDADAIIEVSQREKVKIMVGYVLRFEPAYASIKQAVDEGNAGDIVSVYARRNAPIQEAERLDGRLSVVNYIGVHDFDQILWWHPSKPTKVRAESVNGRVKEKFDTPDFIWTTIEFEDGSIAVVETGWGLPRSWSNWDSPKAWAGFGDVELNVIGSEGVFSLDFTPMDVTGVDSRGGWKLPDTRHWPLIAGDVSGAVKTEMERFFRSIHEDEPSPVTAKESRDSLEIALAAEKSIEEDRPVYLPLDSS